MPLEIAALTYKDVVRESVVREADETSRILGLVAELGVKGVWRPQSEKLFDIHFIDTDAQSYSCRSISECSTFCSQKREEKEVFSCITSTACILSPSCSLSRRSHGTGGTVYSAAFCRQAFHYMKHTIQRSDGVAAHQTVICNLERNKPMCAWMKTEAEEWYWYG